MVSAYSGTVCIRTVNTTTPVIRLMKWRMYAKPCSGPDILILAVTFLSVESSVSLDDLYKKKILSVRLIVEIPFAAALV